MDSDGSGDISVGEFILFLGANPRSVPKPPPSSAAVSLSDDEVSKMRKRLRAASYFLGGQDWISLFNSFDKDRSGELDYEEFKQMLKHAQ